MPAGTADITIPDLRHQRLQKLIERHMTPPNLVLMGLFGQDQWESDTIKWESQIGNRGLTPFVAPGAPSPATAPVGAAEHSAFAATWKEKIYYDEVFLNNLRAPGTDVVHAAKKRLSRDMGMLRGRCDRRKEWMIAKMLTAGSFSYLQRGGQRTSVNYNVPTANMVTLAASRKWNDGTSRNILEDIMDSKITLGNQCGANIDYALFTSEILKLMVLDPSIQTLLQKSAYGEGDLLARPVSVLGSLLDIKNMVKYDEQYQIKAWLTAAVTADSTTQVYVDDPADFEAGGTLSFHDISARTSEDETISSVTTESGIVTVSTAPSTSYKAQEDCVTMLKKYVPTNLFAMFASTVDGQKIAEFANAPYGLDRRYGMKVDSWPEKDPEGVYIRVQNKGLPVLYQSDAIYVLTVT